MPQEIQAGPLSPYFRKAVLRDGGLVVTVIAALFFVVLLIQGKFFLASTALLLSVAMGWNS